MGLDLGPSALIFNRGGSAELRALLKHSPPELHKLGPGFGGAVSPPPGAGWTGREGTAGGGVCWCRIVRGADLRFLSLRTSGDASQERSELSLSREKKDGWGQRARLRPRPPPPCRPSGAGLVPAPALGDGKGYFSPNPPPHGRGERLIPNRQRNAGRPEAGLHSTVLVRGKGLFWSFPWFLPPCPSSPRRGIPGRREIRQCANVHFGPRGCVWHLNVAPLSACGQQRPRPESRPRLCFPLLCGACSVSACGASR